MHAGENLERLLADVFAFEQFGAELSPRGFNLAGEVDFLGAGQQRDLAHLRQVHAHGIIRPVLNLLDENIFPFATRLDLRLRFRFDIGVGNHGCVGIIGEQVGIGLFGVDDLVGELLNLLGIGDNIVLEFIQQRVVQGKAPSWIDLRSSIVR